MENDRSKFKTESKKRLYAFTLQLVEFIDRLPDDNVSKRLGDQLLRSGTSAIGNYVEGQSASSKRDFTNHFNTSLKSCTRANCGSLCYVTVRGFPLMLSTHFCTSLTKYQRFSLRAS